MPKSRKAWKDALPIGIHRLPCGTWVRVPKCLGPSNIPEHGFLGDHAANRICPRCQNVIDKMSLSPMMTCPATDLGADR